MCEYEQGFLFIYCDYYWFEFMSLHSKCIIFLFSQVWMLSVVFTPIKTGYVHFHYSSFVMLHKAFFSGVQNGPNHLRFYLGCKHGLQTDFVWLHGLFYFFFLFSAETTFPINRMLCWHIWVREYQIWGFFPTIVRGITGNYCHGYNRFIFGFFFCFLLHFFPKSRSAFLIFLFCFYPRYFSLQLHSTSWC